MVNLKNIELKNFVNKFKWNKTNTNEINLAKFISKYPERFFENEKGDIQIKRVKRKHKYYTEIKSFAVKLKTTYFYNFGIKETYSNGNYYVRGYLYTQKNISLDYAEILIRDTLPKGYTPEEFYKAEEENNEPDNTNEVILFREEDEIFRREVMI